MANAKETTFYITISVVAFVIGKIVIALLFYKRWKRKHTIHENGFPGIKLALSMLLCEIIISLMF